MSFLPSLASVFGALIALPGLAIGASAAYADPIPGPPLAASAIDRAGAYCPARSSAGSSAAGFAGGALFTAIAARRRGVRD